MRHSIFFVFCICLSLFAPYAFAESTPNFVITLPAAWQRLELPKTATQVFKNSRSNRGEVIVANFMSYPVASKMQANQLVALQESISKIREKYLRGLAIGGYTIHSMELEPSTNPEFQGIITIEASYRGMNGQDVQTVERQYLNPRKMLQVVYSIEAADLGDRSRIKFMLDNLRPRSAGSRSVGFRLGEWLIGDVASANESVKSEASTAPGTQKSGEETDVKITEAKKPAASEVKDICDDLKDPALKGSESDKDLSQVEVMKICGAELKNLVKEIASTIWNAELPVADLKQTARATYQFGKDVYRYATDSAFQAEKNTAAFAAIEAAKDPAKLVKQAFNGFYNYLSKTDPPFICYKPEKQIQMLCNFIGSIGAAKAASLMMKVGTKGVIAKAEGDELTAAAKKAREAEVAASKGQAPAAVGGRAEGTLNAIKGGNRDEILSQAKNLTDGERVQVATQLTKRSLTARESKGLIDSHNVGSGKDYSELTRSEIRQKYEILAKSGYNKAEIKSLMNNGIAGGRADDVIRFSDPSVVRSHMMGAGNSRTPYADAEKLLRAGKSEEASEYYRAAASKAGFDYGAKADAFVKAGDIGEAALTLRGSKDRIQAAAQSARAERAKLIKERDDRSITNKGENADHYYSRSIKNYDEWLEQLKLEAEIAH